MLVLTGLESPDTLRAALGAGVCGFLLTDGPADEFNGVMRRSLPGQGSSPRGWPARRPAPANPPRKP